MENWKKALAYPPRHADPFTYTAYVRRYVVTGFPDGEYMRCSIALRHNFSGWSVLVDGYPVCSRKSYGHALGVFMYEVERMSLYGRFCHLISEGGAWYGR